MQRDKIGGSGPAGVGFGDLADRDPAHVADLDQHAGNPVATADLGLGAPPGAKGGGDRSIGDTRPGVGAEQHQPDVTELRCTADALAATTPRPINTVPAT